MLQHIISHHWQNATAPPDCLLVEQVYRDRAGMQSTVASRDIEITEMITEDHY